MFLIIGIVLGLIALIRLLHSLYSLWGLRASKKAGWRKGIFKASFLKKSRLLGLTLSWLDLIDLTFFPVTTACGLYGLLVYGHVDIIDFYEVRYVEPRPAPS